MTTARDERAPARDAPPPRRRAGTSPGSAGARAAAPIRLAPTATQPLVPGSAGRPLGAEVARSIGLGLGVDVSAVRVHDDAVANQAADERGVRAFAYGTDVYLARGERATDLELMAHEVAHIVQQRGRPVVQLFTTVQTADSLEHEAQSAATAVASGGAATVEGRTETRPQGSIIGRIRGFVSDVVDWVEDRFWDLVRMVAPDLEPILRNFGKWLEEKIAHAFRWVVDKVMAPIRWIEEVIGNVTSHFGDMVAAMKEAAEQIRRGDCHSIADAAGKIVSLVKALGAPIVDRIKDIAGGVAGFFSKLWDKLKDVWGWLKELGGVAGRLVVELGETLWEWTQPIRDAAARAWNWVKGKLGLDGGGGAADGKGGILNWIKEKAQAAWDGLQRFFEPVKKPLIAVAAVVVALSPVGPLLAVAAGAAGLVKGAQWLASKLRDREAIVREHGYLRGVLIPGIMSVVGRVTSAISSAANTAVTVLSRVVGGLGAAVGALAGTVFELVTPLVRWLLSMFTQLVKWAGEKLSGLADWVITGLGRLRAFLQPLLDVISAVGAVIADVFNIVKLIFTKAWHLIPPCIRDPIVNFIRDQILKRIPIFSQLLEIPDIWTKVKETALTIISQIFKHGDLAGAALTFFRAVLSILSIPLELVTGIFTKAASALGTIVRSPIRFLRSVLGAMWQGFKQFFGKILKYLLAGVLDWLTGQLKDAAIEVPSDWSFAGIVKLLLSVLGVTLEKIWKLLGDKIGKPVVEKLKKAVGFLSGAWEWVGALLTEGPAGLWKKLKEEVGQLKEMMVGAIAGYLSETLIVQASVKILTALNPVGAIVNAIILA
ncbi:MAG: hypothetical protein QOH95_1670, partial [Gaiellaceae bacterium]|nr:hypothetical protein [Gaiellaceae bacterium]